MVGGTATQPHVDASRPVTFGSIIVCAGDPGPVTVTDVTLPTTTGGLHVSAFAIRPNPASTGGTPIGIADEPLSSPLLAVSTSGPGPAAPCAGDGSGGSEVLVEVTRPSAEDGCAADGLDVHYRVGGTATDGVLRIPLALAVGAGETPCG
jgi:hypothetical protein